MTMLEELNRNELIKVDILREEHFMVKKYLMFLPLIQEAP